MRSARAESSVMRTRFGFEAAAAGAGTSNARMRIGKTRLALAMSFRIMAVSVKAGGGSRKSAKSCLCAVPADGGNVASAGLDVAVTPRRILYTRSPGPSCRKDVLPVHCSTMHVGLCRLDATSVKLDLFRVILTFGKLVRLVCLVALCAAGSLYLLSCQRVHGAAGSRKVKMIILGVDGLDPDLLTRFMAEGKMPNFARLAAQGSFRRLTTSIPPQSPVAWSNLITGMNAGGHGIFDFIHRDPKNFQLYFSTSKVEGPKHSFQIGRWVIPLGSGSAEQLRHGRAFWEILDENHVPNFVYRIPANFPPIDAKGKTLSGMGTDRKSTRLNSSHL